SDEQVAGRKETGAKVTAEKVQAVVESAEHTHQRGGLFPADIEMLGRHGEEGRVDNGEAERREDLNEEQDGRSLRSPCETAFEKFHPGLLFLSTRRVMSSRA